MGPPAGGRLGKRPCPAPRPLPHRPAFPSLPPVPRLDCFTLPCNYLACSARPGLLKAFPAFPWLPRAFVVVPSRTYPTLAVPFPSLMCPPCRSHIPSLPAAYTSLRRFPVAFFPSNPNNHPLCCQLPRSPTHRGDPFCHNPGSPRRPVPGPSPPFPSGPLRLLPYRDSSPVLACLAASGPSLLPKRPPCP